MINLAYMASIITCSCGFTLSAIWYGLTDDAALASVLTLSMVLSGYGIVRTLDCWLGFNRHL